MSKVDVLAQQLTAEPGVSEVGIEVRRGDSRQKGPIAHGYARVVSDPSYHMKQAKAQLKRILTALKQQPKPNLPKSEPNPPISSTLTKQEDDPLYTPPKLSTYAQKAQHDLRLFKEKQRIRHVVNWYITNDKPIQSKSIFLPLDHPLRHTMISDHERQQLFHEVAKEFKLPANTQIIQDHHNAHKIQLTLPQQHLNISNKPPTTPSQSTPKELINRRGFGGYTMAKPKMSKAASSTVDVLKRLIALKKVDPKTKLPGNLLSKKTAPGVDEEKFDSCVKQVKAQQKDVNPYAVCNAALQKYNLNKDDKPHPKGSPEEKAHAIFEEGASAPKALAELEAKKDPNVLKRFWDHLAMLKDKKQWRSAKNLNKKNECK